MAERLRILCLHGYLQNAETFMLKTGSVRKALKAKAELVYVTAPHPVAVSNVEDGDLMKAASAAPDPHGWWSWQDAAQSARPSTAVQYSGVERSLESLQEAWSAQHFDGILGFSQGATMTVLFLAHLAKHQPTSIPRFCILAAGFLPRDPAWAAVVSTVASLQMRALVVHGERDMLVPLERSRQLQDAMGACCCQTFLHPGGHMVPTCSGDFKRLLFDFLGSDS